MSSQRRVPKSKGRIHPKSKFTEEEDTKLKFLVRMNGGMDWNLIASHMSGRNARQCRDRWRNYLSPSVVNGPWTIEEDNLLEQKYEELGAKWTKIAIFFPTRTDINIKNRWVVKMRQARNTATKSCNERAIAEKESQTPANNGAAAAQAKQQSIFDIASLSFFGEETLCPNL